MKCRLPKGPKLSRATKCMIWDQVNRAVDIKAAEMDERRAERRRREKEEAEREGAGHEQGDTGTI